MICTSHQTLFEYHIKENKVGGACGMYGEDEKRIQGLGWANMKDREHLENKSRSTREGNIKCCLGGLRLPHGMDTWRAVVIMVLDVRHFLTGDGSLSSPEGPCSMRTVNYSVTPCALILIYLNMDQ